jgi:hypothetical protein
MKKIMAMAITVMLLASCGAQDSITAEVKPGGDSTDFEAIKTSLVAAGKNADKYSLGDFTQFVEIASASADPSKSIDDAKADILRVASEYMQNWEFGKLPARAQIIAKTILYFQPFKEVTIFVDPTLASGITKAVIDGNKARLYVPLYTGDSVFDQAFIVALLKHAMGNKKYDMTNIEKLCKKAGVTIDPTDQVLSDLSLPLSTYVESFMSKELRNYVLKTSFDYGHVFSATFQYGSMLGSQDTTTLMVIDQAFEDANKEIYTKLYDKLINPGTIGARLEDSAKVGITVSEIFVNGPAEVAGILPGDAIIAIDTEPVSFIWQFESLLLDKDPNQYVILKVRRSAEGPKDKATTSEPDTEHPGMNYLYFQVLLTIKR